MSVATVVLHGDLEALLPPARRGRAVRQTFLGTAAVKDVVEAAGVPHPEVEFVLVDGAAVTLAQRISGEVRVEVFPFGAPPSPVPHVRAGSPFPEPRRFVLDVHLGSLASNLRMLGFDTLWSNDAVDPALAKVAAVEERILLTRDLGLLKRGEVKHGYFPRATDTDAQVAEVAARFGLLTHAQPFTRCLRCNGALVAVDKSEVEGQLPPRVREGHREFKRCGSCAQVYWKGTHHTEMAARIAALTGDKTPRD